MPSVKDRCGKLWSSSAMVGATSASSLRAIGPLMPMTAHCSVTVVRYTFLSGHSHCSQSSSHAITRAAPPVVVVMRKWLSARRLVTPSSITMPSSPSIRP